MARAGKSVQDPNLLNAALEGLQIQKERIEEQIRQVKAMLGGRVGRAPANERAPAEKPVRRRQLSAAARKRIALAQKRRWAEYRKKPSASKE